MRKATAASVVAWLVIAALSGCSTGGGEASSTSEGAAINVVAAESFWGSIAAQLGGGTVSVTSVISNPDTDPHDYEPRAADGRAVASANYVVMNGAGYDPWVPKLVSASGKRDQVTLDIAALVGVKEGGNPHLWYAPAHVERAIAQISADYKRLDPANASRYDELRTTFESVRLKRYKDLIAGIRQQYAGMAVGASESIVVALVDALGLTLLTPESFLDSVSEGGEATAQDRSTVEAQIRSRQIKVYIYNRQNTTQDVKAQLKLAESANIPVVSVTETPVPAGSPFQDWQASQLEKLSEALGRAKAA